MPATSLSDIQKQTLTELANQHCKALVDAANCDLKQDIPYPSICLTQRGRSAGSALLQKHHIRLNARLFHENQTAFTKEVIAHELAHLITFRLFGRVKPHGVEWKSVMVEVFKLEPKATHCLDVSSVQQKTTTYQCACSDIELSLIRHNRVQRNKQQYMCKKCKTTLTQKI